MARFTNKKTKSFKTDSSDSYEHGFSYSTDSYKYILKPGINEGVVKEISGIIEKTGYLETEIKTENGDILYVPNSLFLKSKYRLRKNKH